MDWMPILKQIFEIFVVPVLGISAIYVCYLIKVKIKELKEKSKNDTERKYLDMLDKTICDTVIATTQTYVEALKKEGRFDAEAQKIAFTKTYEAVMKLLTAEAKTYLETAVGDLQTYVTNKIEAEVKRSKPLPEQN